MKKLLIFLLLFAFGFGAYCEEYLISTTSISRPTGGVTEFIAFGTIPTDGNYRIEFNYTSAYCSLGSHVTNSHAFGTYNNSVYDYVGTGPLFSENFCPFVSSRTGDFLAGDILVIRNYVSSSYATSFSVIIKVYGASPPGVVPVITSSLAVNATAGEPFSYTITATNDPTVFYAGSWPAFLSRSGAVVSGTIPIDQGNFSFVISAGNEFGSSFYKTVNVTVSSPGVAPVITSSLSVDADAGQPFSYTITATGDPTITYGASNLPTFLSFSGSTVSGTIPTGQTVDFSFNISATNDYGSDSETVNVHVIGGVVPIITSPVSVSASSATAFSYTITATGTAPITFSASSLPSFLSFSGSVVSGTLPASLTVVTYSFTVGATNIFGSDSKTITINATAGNDGQFDSDDDVPAINAMKEAIVSQIGVLVGLIEQQNIVQWSGLFVRIDKLLTENTFIDMIVSVKEDINLVKEDTANIALAWSQWGTIWAQFITDYMEPIRGISAIVQQFKTDFGSFHDDFEMYILEQSEQITNLHNTVQYIADVTVGVIGPAVLDIKDDTGVIRTDTAIIKTNVIEINTKLSNIADLIALINTDNDAQMVKLESIKGVLNQQLTVQQNQLTTQESILALLDQIANPPADPPPPLMPDNPDDPVTPDYAIDFTFDKESNSGNLQKYEKTFPIFDSALRQRIGTLPYTFRVPLSEITPLLDDRYVVFNDDSVIGNFVSGIRAILCCILFYFTLKYWFCAVRRITD